MMPLRPPTLRPAHALSPQQARQLADRDRGSASARGYGRRWQKARDLFLMQHPLCACGCERAATEVDHIRPHRGDATLFWDRSNWQGLTKACHSAKTARGA